MTEIRLVKKYPHIKDEDVTSIFQEGYVKGFENGRKDAIPIEWIRKMMDKYKDWEFDNFCQSLIETWEKENETNRQR